MKITSYEIHTKAEEFTLKLYNSYIIELDDMESFTKALETLIKTHSKGCKEWYIAVTTNVH